MEESTSSTHREQQISNLSGYNIFVLQGSIKIQKKKLLTNKNSNFRIMLYPVTVASFKKFKFEKYKFRTEAETHGSSWVLKNFIKNNKKAIDSRRANYADVKNNYQFYIVIIFYQ